ncbi:hypothetical protein EWM64_g4911 [Hericium alpestre]|uniref:Uncharacterized protein n=1 Tax=Hericium alpestre TaxID=135208 RepID=A0A4Y9ZY31_9AGAM|nr:hypothetical protein EWM64_g4911 [Hericium alpestre]
MDPFHTLSVFYNDDGETIGLKLWQTSSIANSSAFHPAHDPDLFISICLPTEHTYFSEPIEAMCDMLPLDNTHIIII